MSVLHRNLEQFFDLTDGEHDHLDELLKRRDLRFPPWRTVLAQGRHHDTAFVVASGWLIEHWTLRDGARQILSIRLAGDLIGVDGLAYRKSIFATTTLTDVELIPMPIDAFERLQCNAPRLGTPLLVMTLRTEALLREWEVNLGRRSASTRLAHLLLELRERQKTRGLADGACRPLPLTQQELGDALGITSEHINRMMRRLREQGIAHVDDRGLVVTDEKALRDQAAFDDAYLGRLAASQSTS